jgi:hypothetical protein
MATIPPPPVLGWRCPAALGPSLVEDHRLGAACQQLFGRTGTPWYDRHGAWPHLCRGCNHVFPQPGQHERCTYIDWDRETRKESEIEYYRKCAPLIEQLRREDNAKLEQLVQTQIAWEQLYANKQ